MGSELMEPLKGLGLEVAQPSSAARAPLIWALGVAGAACPSPAPAGPGAACPQDTPGREGTPGAGSTFSCKMCGFPVLPAAAHPAPAT